MKCQFLQLESKHWKCSRCNYITRSQPEESPLRECNKKGLGDRLELFLLSIGITQDLYKWLRGNRRIVGGFVCRYENIPPEEAGCDCDSRKDWLNWLGSKICL